VAVCGPHDRGGRGGSGQPLVPRCAFAASPAFYNSASGVRSIVQLSGYSLIRADATTLVWKVIDSRAEPEQLLPPGNLRAPHSVSPDGKTLAYTEVDPTTGADIWTLSLTGSPEPKPFLRTRFSEGAPVFSPDGRWLAYISNESGVIQVYAARFPDGRGKVQVSTDGGTLPQWSANGRELFYVKRDAMMSVAVAKVEIGQNRRKRGRI
jgi:Tol biopolymer transport system component